MDNTSAQVLHAVGSNFNALATDAGAAALAADADADASGPDAQLDPAAAKLATAVDTGAVELVIPESEITAALRRMGQTPGGLSEEKVVGLVRKNGLAEARLAHVRGHARGFSRALQHMRGRGGLIANDLQVPWTRSLAQQVWREDIIARYMAIHGGPKGVSKGRGFYYGTFQVPMSVESYGTTQAAFVINVPPSTNPSQVGALFPAFNLALNQTEAGWFGGPHLLDPSDTNLQNPGQNIYPDEVFIIEAISARLKGVRVQYFTPGGTSPFPSGGGSPVIGPTTLSMLSGGTPIWDRAAHVLPPEFFNQYNDTNEMAQALAEVSTIYFEWDNNGIGGSNSVNTKLIERFSAVPGVHRTGMRETAGGAMILDLPRGYLWMLDQQFQATVDEGGNGLFRANLAVNSSVVFPFQPIALYGSGGPLPPIGAALEWQIALHGTSLLPAQIDRYAYSARRKM
jgi:hypothetical protein